MNKDLPKGKFNALFSSGTFVECHVKLHVISDLIKHNLLPGGVLVATVRSGIWDDKIKLDLEKLGVKVEVETFLNSNLKNTMSELLTVVNTESEKKMKVEKKIKKVVSKVSVDYRMKLRLRQGLLEGKAMRGLNCGKDLS